MNHASLLISKEISLTPSGQSLQGSGSLHGSPTMQRLGSAGVMPAGGAPGMMRNRGQQQPGMHGFSQGLGQMSQGQMSQMQMSQGMRMDPSTSPHQQQRHPGMYQRSYSPAGVQQMGAMSLHGQGGLMPGGMMPGEMAQQQMGQSRGMHSMQQQAMPAWEQMRPGPDAPGAPPLCTLMSSRS